jgi:hypothetical protein
VRGGQPSYRLGSELPTEGNDAVPLLITYSLSQECPDIDLDAYFNAFVYIL